MGVLKGEEGKRAAAPAATAAAGAAGAAPAAAAPAAAAATDARPGRRPHTRLQHRRPESHSTISTDTRTTSVASPAYFKCEYGLSK